MPLANDLHVRRPERASPSAPCPCRRREPLAYLAGAAAPSELLWLDRTGKRLGSLGEPGDYGDVALAPDGAHASVSVTDPVQIARHIWIYDVARGLRPPLHGRSGGDSSAIWSPDGSRLMFRSARKGLGDLYEKLSTGAVRRRALVCRRRRQVSTQLVPGWTNSLSSGRSGHGQRPVDRLDARRPQAGSVSSHPVQRNAGPIFAGRSLGGLCLRRVRTSGNYRDTLRWRRRTDAGLSRHWTESGDRMAVNSSSGSAIG